MECCVTDGWDQGKEIRLADGGGSISYHYGGNAPLILTTLVKKKKKCPGTFSNAKGLNAYKLYLSPGASLHRVWFMVKN